MVNYTSRVRWTEVLIDDCSARRAEALALLGPNIAVRKAAPLHAGTSGSEEHALADVSIFFITSSDAAPPRRQAGGGGEVRCEEVFDADLPAGPGVRVDGRRVLHR